MKSIFYLLFILIITFSCKTTINISKNTDIVKKLDTIYVLFEEGNNQTKSKFNFYKNKPPLENGLLYHFKLNEKDFIEFRHKKYLNWDSMITKDSSKVLTKNKNFLKNNVFIDYSYFLENKLCGAISSIKTIKIFIIDKAEFTNKKIVLRQVYFFSSCESEL